MQSSMFNLRVPLPEHDEVFLMNTLTDAQLVVSSDVAALLDLPELGGHSLTGDAKDAFDLLCENGFIVRDRESDRQALDAYFTRVKSDASELNITILTTLQCNFACDYCYQGDHGDHNKFADKMSLETATKVGDWIEREMDRQHPKGADAHVFWRRAAAQPAGRLRDGGTDVGREHPARHDDADQRHHQRDAAHRRGRGPAAAVRVERHQGHARRRSRRAQPDASAARRSGHLRPHRREYSKRRGEVQYLDWRKLRRNVGGQLPGAPRFPARAGLRRQAREGEVQADHPQRHAACDRTEAERVPVPHARWC